MKKLAVILLLLAGGVPELPAQIGVFNEKGVRDSLSGLVRAFEDQDIDAVRLSLAQEFLEGNPEVIGRVRDSFERFEKTRLNYRIASIRLMDSIAAVRLNWTKTTTDRMNSWTYRDIGNEVVMYFSALEPYQLVGLQESNLFGVSFLLQTRIVVAVPALAKLEMDRRKLELEERRLALEELRTEQARIRAEEEAREKERLEQEAATRARAQAELRAHMTRTADPPAVVAPPDVAAEPPRLPEEPVVPPAPVKPPDRTPARPPTPPPVREPRVAPAPPVKRDPAPEPERQPTEIARDVRDRAEAEAMHLLERHRQFMEMERAPAEPAPAMAAPSMPAQTPEVDAWRREKLQELQRAQAPLPARPVERPVLPPQPEVSVEEARRRAAERARRLEEDEALPKPIHGPATPDAADPPDEPFSALRRIEQVARIEAEVRSRADEEALSLLRMRSRAALPDPEPSPEPSPSAVMPERPRELPPHPDVRARVIGDVPPQPVMEPEPPPADVDDFRRLADDIRARAAAPVDPVPDGPARVDDLDPHGHEIEVAVARPEETVSVTPSLRAEDALPDMRKISGGEQPGGPDYDFYMSRYEVTNADFCRFLNDLLNHPAHAQNAYIDADGNVFMSAERDPLGKLFSMTNMDFDGVQTGVVFADGSYAPAPGRERHPVVGVSWYGALKYCNWLTMVTGLGARNLCYAEGPQPHDWRPIDVSGEQWISGFSNQDRRDWLENRHGFRLPMNNFNATADLFNEFFLAAAWNGERNTVYGYGRDAITPADANYMTHTPGARPAGTTPVGFFNGAVHNSFVTNPNDNRHGVYDLSGNVWEWSNDTTGNIDYRALFGGSWRSDQDSVTTSYRGSIAPYNTADHVGFRVVSMRLPAAEYDPSPLSWNAGRPAGHPIIPD